MGRIAGNGRWVVLLHGQPGSGADWKQVEARLPYGLRVLAPDRPGYGASRRPAGGFTAGARALLADMDARGIDQAVLVGHSYGGGVALTAARLAPERVAGLVLLASVGPGCLTGADGPLAAPVSGEFLALMAWRLTPWLARAGLAAVARLRRRPLAADELVNLQVWGYAHREHGPLWRSFLAEQRALMREVDDLAASLPEVTQPVLLMADAHDMIIPVRATHRLAAALPDARVELLTGPGHHLPRRAAPRIAEAIAGFLATLGDQAAA